MLKRLYVDNYKCLVNFDLNFNAINLFLGANGSGKSTVFEVLQKLRAIVNGDSRISEEFKPESRTRWQTSPLQSFEVEITKDNRTYRYELAVEYSKNEQTARVKHERLYLDNQPLLKFEGQEARIYKVDFSEGLNFPFDGSRSVIEFFPQFNVSITQFKVRMNEILVVHIDPRLVNDVSEKAQAYPSKWMDNYSSWYSYLSRDQSWVFELTNALKEVLPGFEYFRFTEAGEKFSILRAVFSGQDNNSGTKREYRFAELSDGQRALIVLYTLLIAAQKENYVLCIDEPENFLALPEIQPWLLQLYDSCSEGKTQALLISHHPELINYLLASPVGYWFEREANTPVRVKQIVAESNGGLPVSELIARGWLSA
ncbi:MAG: AAA family ATPase [Chloroflexi bacterium]|nr:AAA family ATPase [Chloroflexota bacterium]